MNIRKLFDNFIAARAAWQPLSKQHAELQRAALSHVASFDPRLLNVGNAAESLEAFIAQTRKGEPREIAADILRELNATREAVTAAGQKYQAAKDALTASVSELRYEKMISLLTQRKQVIEEITAFLTPFCESEQRARELAAQCDQPANLELSSTKYRTLYDLESAAKEFLT